MFLAAFSFRIASKLQDIPNVSKDPGGFFVISTTLADGRANLLIWLGTDHRRPSANGLACCFSRACSQSPALLDGRTRPGQGVIANVSRLCDSLGTLVAWSFR